MICIIISLVIFNIYWTFGRTKNIVDNSVYCVGGQQLTKEINKIDGTKCFILRYQPITNNTNVMMTTEFYDKITNSTDKICSETLNENECNRYDEYFFKKQWVSDSSMIGNFYELVGVRYVTTNFTEIKNFEQFFKESEKVSYEEGFRRIKDG